jgi:hypothetical protein
MRLKSSSHLSVLFLTLTFLPGSFALAGGLQESCSDLDIQKINPRIDFPEPVSQLNAGWCYAFVAADMLSAETGKHVSYAHTMAIYNRSLSQSLFSRSKNELQYQFAKNKPQFRYVYEAGNATDAIKSVVKTSSVCSEESMPYTVNLIFIERLDRFQTKLRSKNYVPSENDLNEMKEILTLNRYTNSDPQTVLNNLRTININETYERVMKENCKEFINLNPLHSITMKKPRLSSHLLNYLNSINSVLEIGKPVGIGYNTSLIEVGGNGAHASLITARRFNNETCEYKIRNSWGKTCDKYKPGIECVKEEGSYWVSDKTLLDMLFEYYYIK